MTYLDEHGNSGLGPVQIGGAPVTTVLLVQAAGHTCALDLSQVIEIMRPLPVDQVAGVPGFVSGLSRIRGMPVPVVSLAALFGVDRAPCTRFVIVRAGQRRVALSVQAVPGVQEFSTSALGQMPPLLRDAAAGAIQAVGASDSELLFILNMGILVPAGSWPSLAGQEP